LFKCTTGINWEKGKIYDAKLDFEIIKYHYSYGICKFTDLETFEENHTHAKEAIKNGGKMFFTHSN
jgi:hypothetical protein